MRGTRGLDWEFYSLTMRIAGRLEYPIRGLSAHEEGVVVGLNDGDCGVVASAERRNRVTHAY
jgi:hypothetical protein